MHLNRLAAAAGIGYVLLAFVEFFGPGFPHTGDPARVLDAYFVAHRSWSLAAVVVQGFGNAIWIVFLCGLTLNIRRAGSIAAATVALVGGALNVAISLTGLASIAALAFRVAGSGDPAVTRAFFERRDDARPLQRPACRDGRGRRLGCAGAMVPLGELHHRDRLRRGQRCARAPRRILTRR